MADLIKTIGEDDDVADLSEESDVEVEYQPKKRAEIRSDREFNNGFEFVSSAAEYNKETWNDLHRYVRRNATNKTDEKIKESRRLVECYIPEVSDEEDEFEKTKKQNMETVGKPKGEHSDDELSDTDMRKDNVKEREKLKGKRKKKKSKIDDANNEDSLKIEGEDVEGFFDDAPPLDEHSSFYQMNLSRPLMKAIGSLNYIHPTPIQAAAIPVALLGRDICGCAATGTGKTAAYMLPILERLLYRPKSFTAVTRVLVLVPTRELGVQVYQVTKQLAQFTSVEVGLSVGGLEVKHQETILRKNPDIVIATPGRLIDHLQNTPTFSIDDIEVLVLDEADRMLDENFSEQMKQIIKMCSMTRQTMLFSATMTEAVTDLASVCLNKPVKIFVDSNQDVAFNLRQEFVRLREGKETDRDAILAALVCRTFRDHTMVFVRTKMDAHKVLVMLGLFGLRVSELHGNLTQPQRLEALRKFKEEQTDILVATDVAARGLDIRGVKTVINYVMPPTLEHYIHRVGRTARAGKAGVSVSIASEADRKVLKQIIKRARNPVKNRIILPDIIEKYRERVEAVQGELKRILNEEKEERLINRAERDIERGEKLLHGSAKAAGKKHPRSWFQTQRERKVEKERSKEIFDLKVNGPKTKRMKRKHDKGKEMNEEDAKMQRKMLKLEHQQARLAKMKQKPRRIKAVHDSFQFNVKKDGSKKRSAFTKELTDVGRASVKKARYLGPNRKKWDTNAKSKGRK